MCSVREVLSDSRTSTTSTTSTTVVEGHVEALRIVECAWCVKSFLLRKSRFIYCTSLAISAVMGSHFVHPLCIADTLTCCKHEWRVTLCFYKVFTFRVYCYQCVSYTVHGYMLACTHEHAR